MSRVFVSHGSGAGVYVFADDHCPPHVHARHRGEGWIARVKFSYVSRLVNLISLAPQKNVPLPRVTNRLLVDVQSHLVECRLRWRQMHRTTCLANQWAVISAIGRIELVAEPTLDANQIGTAHYDPVTQWLQITFQGGTTAELSASR